MLSSNRGEELLKFGCIFSRWTILPSPVSLSLRPDHRSSLMKTLWKPRTWPSSRPTPSKALPKASSSTSATSPSWEGLQAWDFLAEILTLAKCSYKWNLMLSPFVDLCILVLFQSNSFLLYGGFQKREEQRMETERRTFFNFYSLHTEEERRGEKCPIINLANCTGKTER